MKLDLSIQKLADMEKDRKRNIEYLHEVISFMDDRAVEEET